jgi:hypothetical protein
MTDDKDKRKEPEKKTLEHYYCPIHRQSYPKGGECPGCEAERRKKN